MKRTTIIGALLALNTAVAGFALVSPRASPAADAAATAVAVPVAASALVQDRDQTLLKRASRSRSLTATPPRTRRRVQRPEPVRVVVRTRIPARVVRPRTQAVAVTFTDQEMRVRSCESGANGSATHGRAHDYDYTAQNPSSTASGAWQFLDSTWNDFGGYSHAASAPRSVQDSMARQYINANGLTPWAASQSCWSG